jgi:molybdate transport system regulatory protein
MAHPNGSGSRTRYRPRVDLVIEKNGQEWLSLKTVTLLEAIETEGSISAAAQRVRLPYRWAWQKLSNLEQGVGRKLLSRKAGGQRGGGTRLTPAGRKLVAQFRRFAAGLERQVAQRFERVYRSRGA